MCGVVGVIPKGRHGFNRDEQKVFYEMLLADMVRGYDATGIIAVQNNSDFSIMKEASLSSTFVPSFIESPVYNNVYQTGCAAIGHNRARTVGENSDENAHPFVVDDTFAMVHNGTLRNHKLFHDTTVDSEALAMLFKAAMDEDNYVQALSEAIWKVNGAFACIWFDQKRRQIGIVRNTERPLYLVDCEKTVLISSELGLPLWIAERNNMKVVSSQPVKDNVLYLFDMSKGGALMEEFPLSQRPLPIPVVAKEVNGVTKTMATILDTSHGDAASKSRFKRLRNKWVGKRAVFCMDDWVEKNYPAEGGTEILLLGNCNNTEELKSVRHTAKGVINMNDLDMTIKSVDDQFKWTGLISSMEFNVKQRQIEIQFTDLKPLVRLETVH